MSRHQFDIEFDSKYEQYVWVKVKDERHTFEVGIKHEDEGVVIDVFDDEENFVDTMCIAYADFRNRLEDPDG